MNRPCSSLLLGLMTTLSFLAGPAFAQLHSVVVGSAPAPVGNSTAGFPESDCDIAINRSGDGVLVWRERLSAPPATSYRLRAQRLQRRQPIGAPLEIGTVDDFVTGTNELTVMRCACDEFGNWAVVWNASDPVIGGLGVYLRRFSVVSNTLGPGILVTDGPGTQLRVFPDVAVGPHPQESQSSVYIVWQDDVQAGFSTIRMRRYRIDDTNPASILDVPFPIMDVPSNGPTAISGMDRPAIVVNAIGHVSVIWERFDEWAPQTYYWRILLRRFSGTQALSITPQGSIPFTDEFTVSLLNDPAFPSSAVYPPRIAQQPNGDICVVWRRQFGSPLGLRRFDVQASGSATPLSAITHLPLTSAPGFGHFDVASSNHGELLLLWEQYLSPVGVSGRAFLSRIDWDSGTSREELVFDPVNQQSIRALSVSTDDGGGFVGLVSRGSAQSNIDVRSRRGDLNFLRKNIGQSTVLSLWIPAHPNLGFELWPLTQPSSPATYALTTLPDGRSADLSLSDPLLQFHFSQGGVWPVLPDARGTLDNVGEALITVNYPPSLPPINFPFSVVVIDPTQGSLVNTIPMFTQPALIPLP